MLDVFVCPAPHMLSFDVSERLALAFAFALVVEHLLRKFSFAM